MSTYNLTPEQQDEIRRRLKGTRLEALAISSGLLPPPDYEERILKEMVRKSASTLALVKDAKILSKVDEPVLITGPTGSGKELVAGLVHGCDRKGRFVPVNTTAIVDTLFESELFGHKQGSFTGANENRLGLIAEASNGTLFLDEIGDMGLSTQAKLLRLIENRQYRMVGDSKLLDSNCRIVCATHRDLAKLVKQGKFREDLFYRISVFELKVAPLKERREDYEYLAASFDLPEEASDTVWHLSTLPGNVRQLKNIARYYNVLGKLPPVISSTEENLSS